MPYGISSCVYEQCEINNVKRKILLVKRALQSILRHFDLLAPAEITDPYSYLSLANSRIRAQYTVNHLIYIYIYTLCTLVFMMIKQQKYLKKQDITQFKNNNQKNRIRILVPIRIFDINETG